MPKFDKIILVVLAVLFAGGLLAAKTVLSQEQHTYQGQFSISPAKVSGVFDPTQMVGYFHGEKVAVAQPLDMPLADRKVLGDSDAPKRIEVDLAEQRVYAFEGDTKVYDFLISSGKWGRTPTGTFRIWGKFRATKMEGGNKERNTYYYLPNVPYVMFFSNDEVPASRGFSLHGTYWHSNFGTPMSHGCINMKTEEAEQLYYWANPDLGDKKTIRASEENPGTEVIIYGTAPETQ